MLQSVSNDRVTTVYILFWIMAIRILSPYGLIHNIFIINLQECLYSGFQLVAAAAAAAVAAAAPIISV